MNNNLDILFVLPAYTDEHVISYTGPLILATELDKAGITAGFISYTESEFLLKDFNKFINDICNKILEYNSKIVSLFLRGDSLHIQVQIAKKLKALKSDLIIVGGGPAVNISGKQIFEVYQKYFDCLSAGEGETVIVPLIQSILQNKLDRSIAGLIYLDDQKVICNKQPEFLLDDYTLDRDIYYLLDNKYITDTPSITLDVGRGCPFSCRFCTSHDLWHNRYRLRDLSDIIETIRYIKEKYNISVFDFSHDNFTANKNRVRQFCKLLKESQLDISFSICARIDCLDYDLLKDLKEVGLNGLFVGIESGAQHLQPVIGKNLHLDAIDIIANACMGLNIDVWWSFMYGFPEETQEDLEQTLELIYDLRKKSIALFHCGLHELYLDYSSNYYLTDSDKLVYKEDRLKSDLCITFGLNECLDEIKDHPTLYCSFYTLNSYTITNFEYTCLYAQLFEAFPLTMYYTVKTKNKLEFVNELTTCIKSNGIDLTNYSMYSSDMQDVYDLYNNILEHYIIDHSELDTDTLTSLLKFEYMCKHMKSGKIPSNIAYYKFNYQKVKNLDDDPRGLTRLELIKSADNKFEIMIKGKIFY